MEVAPAAVNTINSAPTYCLKSSPVLFRKGSCKRFAGNKSSASHFFCADEETGANKLVPMKAADIVPSFIKFLLDVFIRLVNFADSKIKADKFSKQKI